MRKIVLTLSAFFAALTVNVRAQNLCPNPSFETNSGCPTSVAQVTNAVPWINPPAHGGSADYFHTCGTGLVTVPNNFAGNEMPATGQAYMGLCLMYQSYIDFREYIEIQLSQTLVAGQCYELSFKYSACDGGQYATDRIGAYFSSGTCSGTGSWNPLPFVPQAQNTLGNYLNVTNGWGTVSMQFTAAGGENYMTIGNFFNDAVTSIVQYNATPQYSVAYVYLDDIDLHTCPTSALNVSPNVSICLGQSATLSATGGSGYWWATSTLPNDTAALGSPVTVSPTTTTTYVVTSGAQTASVVVTVNMPPTVALGNDTTVCAGQQVIFDAQNPGSTYVWSPSGSGQTITVSTPGQYVVTVTNAAGCTSSDTVQLANSPSPVVSLAAASICPGGQATLDAGNPGCTYAWNTGDTTQMITINMPGTYSVVVTNAGGCTASASVNVTNSNTTAASVSPNNVSCFGANDGTATASVVGGTGPYSYLWSTTDTTVAINNLGAGTYTVTITDANGCFDTAVVTVTEPALLTLQASAAPAAVCSGQSATLSATPGGGTPTYGIVWLPGNLIGGPQTVTPTATTTYTANVTDLNGCTTSATTVVTVNPVPVSLFAGDSLQGCAPLCVNFTDQSTVTAPGVITSWNWDFGDNTTSTQQNPSHCYNSSGNYTVVLTVQTGDGCVHTLTLNNYVQVYAMPVAGFTMSPQPTTLFNAQIYFTDSSTNATSWLWNFGDVDSSSSILQNPTFTYGQPTCYQVTLTVSNPAGCTDVAVNDVCIDPDISIYAPNAFTPDGNGLNEVFLPQTVGIDPAKYHMWIFDRWGNLIFETTDLNKGWDGHANGGAEVAQIDTYVWKIVATDTKGGVHSLIGSVNLIK